MTVSATVCPNVPQARFLLKSGKLLKARREGKQVFYSLADDHVRTIIAMGEVSGIIESHIANEPSGLVEMLGTNTMARISGIVMGIVYCCESLSLSTTEPVAA